MDSVSMGNKRVICTILVQFADPLVSTAGKGLTGEAIGAVEKASLKTEDLENLAGKKAECNL